MRVVLLVRPTLYMRTCCYVERSGPSCYLALRQRSQNMYRRRDERARLTCGGLVQRKCARCMLETSGNQPSSASDTIVITARQLATSVFNATAEMIGPVLDAKLSVDGLKLWCEYYDHKSHANKRLRIENLGEFVVQNSSFFDSQDAAVANAITSYRVCMWMHRAGAMMTNSSINTETVQNLQSDYVKWFTDFVPLSNSVNAGAAADPSWGDVMRLLKSSPFLGAGGMLTWNSQSRHVVLHLHAHNFSRLCVRVFICACFICVTRAHTYTITDVCI